MGKALNLMLAVVLLALTQLAFGAWFGAADGANLAILPALISGAASLLGRKAVKKAGQWVAGRVAGSAAGRAGAAVGRVAGTAVTLATRYPTLTSTAAGTIAGTMLSPGLNPFAPQGGPQGGTPTPREGVVGRTISRILPGGMTGREWMPYEGTEADKYGRPIAVHPAEKVVAWAPRGYVMVTVGDQRVAMLRQAAIAMGLWSAPPKPPISGWDARAIRRAASATKRVKKLAAKVGFTCTKKGKGGKC